MQPQTQPQLDPTKETTTYMVQFQLSVVNSLTDKTKPTLAQQLLFNTVVKHLREMFDTELTQCKNFSMHKATRVDMLRVLEKEKLVVQLEQAQRRLRELERVAANVE